MRVCFISSSGGHYEQLLILKPLMEKYNGFIVTEKTIYNSDVGYRNYKLIQINRKEQLWIIKIIINALKSFYIFCKEKPDIIISTGVLSTIPMCLLSKIFKKKLIYIESFAKVDTPTLTGKLLYKVADQFYVQWPQMLSVYPNAIYIGGIY